MFNLSLDPPAFLSDHGSLAVLQEDEISFKLAMILEGELGAAGPCAAAAKFGYTRQRYYQIKHAYLARGALALQDLPRGPKSNYRRTDERVRLVIRHRFLDPDISAEVIAQKLTQARHPISTRSVQRVIADYGLQKKTLRP